MTKHGRYSKHIPTRLAGKYETDLADADLLAMRDEIALIDARVSQLLEQMGSGESADLWSGLKDAMLAYDLAPEEHKNGRLDVVRNLIEQGGQDTGTWAEIRQTIGDRRKAVETEIKRVSELEDYAKSKAADIMVGALVRSIRRHVTDPTILSAISDDLRAVAVTPSR